MSNRLIGIGLAVAAAVVTPPVWAGLPDWEEGLKQYQSGLYQQAAISFARAEGTEPTKAIVHYYLANTLVYLNQHKQAMQEYRICYALKPAGAMAKYCQDALAAYKQTGPDQREMQQLRDTKSGANQRRRTDVVVAPDKVAIRADKPPEVNHSLLLIRRQLECEKKKHESLGEATAQDALSSAKSAVRSVQESVEQQVQRMYASQPRRLAYANDLQAREQQIRDQGKEVQEYLLRQGQEKAERYRRIGEMQKVALEQVADNLERQMSDDGRTSGIRLMPTGTNLYVRSYAVVRPARVVPDAHAAVARIYAQHYEDVPVNRESANDMQAEEAQSSRLVHGKILRQP